MGTVHSYLYNETDDTVDKIKDVESLINKEEEVVAEEVVAEEVVAEEVVAEEVAEIIGDITEEVTEKVAKEVEEIIGDITEEGEIIDTYVEEIHEPVNAPFSDDIIDSDVRELVTEDIIESNVNKEHNIYATEQFYEDVTEKINIIEKINEDVIEKMNEDVTEKIREDVKDKVCENIKEINQEINQINDIIKEIKKVNRIIKEEVEVKSHKRKRKRKRRKKYIEVDFNIIKHSYDTNGDIGDDGDNVSE